MTKSFNDMHINSNLIAALEKQDINSATEIQEKVIPEILDNKDVIIQSPTGTGKTLAYLLPLFEKLQKNSKDMQAVILAPTHELSMQIANQVKLLCDNGDVDVRFAAIIGEVNINRQIEKLKKDKPNIIIGSAGRIDELIKMKKIKMHTVKTIIVDEGDKLLESSNLESIKGIIKSTLKERQIVVCSATINEDTLKECREFMKEPKFVKVEGDVINNDIAHMYISCEFRKKIETLRSLIHAEKPAKAIVFMNKNEEIQLATAKLHYHNFKVYGMYGDAPKEERKKAIDDFRSGKINVLISSDLGARGLHIENVTHIINLDIPEDAKEYLHRAGRTGRAGNKGRSISIVLPRDRETLKKHSRKLNFELKEKELYNGKLIDYRDINRTEDRKKFKKTYNNGEKEEISKAKPKKDKYENKKINNKKK